MEHVSYSIVAEADMEERVDKLLSRLYPDFSRSYIQKLIRDGLIIVDGKQIKNNYRISEGEHITLFVPEPQELVIMPENIPLSILYEDDDILIVDKPKDMVVHPACGHMSHTLVNAVLYHCKGQLSGINGVLRPGIVHRIDKDTTGSLVICKTDRAHRSLSDQLRDHRVTRTYEAIVLGNVKADQGTIEGMIGRHPTDRKKMSTHCKNGKYAVTHYTVLERFGKYSHIQCVLETGRTHQIRVHMASIGHPLLGDTVYGTSGMPKSLFGIPLTGQTLHARSLGFVHPTTGEYIEFEAPIPLYMTRLLDHMRKLV